MRKKIKEEHIDAVTRYAESADRCRSVMLLEYFGERNAKPCGQCDYCIRHKEREITRAEWDSVEKELYETAEEDIVAISRKTGINEHKVIEIIRQIKDNE